MIKTTIPLLRQFHPGVGVRTIAVVLVVVVFSGCSLLTRGSDARRRAALQKALAEDRARPVLVGRITLVNTADGFVLIDAAGAQAPATDTALRAYTGAELSGELRATGVHRRPFLIADITKGQPKRGDTVLRPGSGEPVPARAAAAASPAPAPKARPL